MNRLLGPINNSDKTLFINRIKALHLDLPCYNPATGSLVNEGGIMLKTALDGGHLPHLKVLQVQVLELGSDLLTEAEDNELLDWTIEVAEICKKRKLCWSIILELDQESYQDEDL